MERDKGKNPKPLQRLLEAFYEFRVYFEIEHIARIMRLKDRAECQRHFFPRIVDFPGFLWLYSEGSRDPRKNMGLW